MSHDSACQSNRLEAHLKIYFPQIPHWFGDVVPTLLPEFPRG